MDHDDNVSCDCSMSDSYYFNGHTKQLTIYKAECLLSFIKQFDKIYVLCFCQDSITKDDSFQLAEFLKCHQEINELIFMDSKLDWQIFDVIEKVLRIHKGIISIEITNCILDETLMIIFAYILNMNKIIKNLTLEKCNLNTSIIKCFSYGLKYNSSLVSISFSKNLIDDDSLVYILDAIESNENSNLTKLVISGELISDKGLIQITNVLKNNKKITHLSLDRNNIEDVDEMLGKDLVSLFLQNKNLIQFDISNNVLSTNSFKILMKYFKETKHSLDFYFPFHPSLSKNLSEILNSNSKFIQNNIHNEIEYKRKANRDETIMNENVFQKKIKSIH